MLPRIIVVFGNYVSFADHWLVVIEKRVLDGCLGLSSLVDVLLVIVDHFSVLSVPHFVEEVQVFAQTLFLPLHVVDDFLATDDGWLPHDSFHAVVGLLAVLVQLDDFVRIGWTILGLFDLLLSRSLIGFRLNTYGPNEIILSRFWISVVYFFSSGLDVFRTFGPHYFLLRVRQIIYGKQSVDVVRHVVGLRVLFAIYVLLCRVFLFMVCLWTNMSCCLLGDIRFRQFFCTFATHHIYIFKEIIFPLYSSPLFLTLIGLQRHFLFISLHQQIEPFPFFRSISLLN